MTFSLNISRRLLLGVLLLGLAGGSSQLSVAQSSNRAQATSAPTSCAGYPTLQACLNAAGAGAEVFVPAGVYELQAPLAPLDGQTIECAGGTVTAGSGAIVRPLGAIWAFGNPSPSTRQILSVTVRNCVFDLSRTPAALGAINLRGISWAKFYNPRILLAATGAQIGIQFDAEFWNTTSASYWNDVFGADIYAMGNNWASGNSHTCLLFLNQANDNHVYGGSCNRVDIGIKMESGDNNLISGFGVDGWGAHCIFLGAGPNTSFNLFLHNRCETYPPSVVSKKASSAIYITRGAVDNQIMYPMVFGIAGTTPLVDDSDGANTIFGALNATSTGIVSEITSRSKIARLGINKSPEVALDVSGVVQSDKGFVPMTPGSVGLGAPDKPFAHLYLGSGTGKGLDVTTAPTSARKISFPDASGELSLVLRGTTSAIGGARLSAGQCTTGSANIPGATTSMVAVASAAGSDPGGPFLINAYVSSPGVVSVRVCALSAGTPAPAKYSIRVLQ